MKVCVNCGAEYERDADYCNVCRMESLVAVEPPPAPRRPRRPLRDDLNAVLVAAVTWIIGLGYLIGDLAPRELGTLMMGWLMLTLITLVAGMILSNLRVFVAFAVLGMVCCVIYAAVKLA